MPENVQYPAMILAAGLGKRMRSHDESVPKPLVHVAGRPLIDYSLQLLRNAQISKAVVNTHYMAEKIQDYLGRQEAIDIAVSHEEQLLETGGGLMKAMPLLQQPFFVLNSDIICCDTPEPVLKRLQQTWDETEMDALLLLQPVEKATGYEGEGDFSVSEDGVIHPRREDNQAYVFTGIQMLHQRFFDQAPQEAAFSLSILYRQYLLQGSKRLHALIHTGEWFHVGDTEGVKAANDYLLSHAA